MKYEKLKDSVVFGLLIGSTFTYLLFSRSTFVLCIMGMSAALGALRMCNWIGRRSV